MSRSARLLDLIQALRRRRRPVSRCRIGRRNSVFRERTIYRDIATLCGQGAPIEGEAGLGYVLRPGFHAAAADVHRRRDRGAGARLCAGSRSAPTTARGGRHERAGEDRGGTAATSCATASATPGCWPAPARADRRGQRRPGTDCARRSAPSASCASAISDATGRADAAHDLAVRARLLRRGACRRRLVRDAARTFAISAPTGSRRCRSDGRALSAPAARCCSGSGASSEGIRLSRSDLTLLTEFVSGVGYDGPSATKEPVMPDPNFIDPLRRQPRRQRRVLCRPARPAAGRILATFAMFALESGHDARPVVAPHRDAGCHARRSAAAKSPSPPMMPMRSAPCMQTGSARNLTIVQAPTDLDFGHTFVALDP